MKIRRKKIASQSSSKNTVAPPVDISLIEKSLPPKPNRSHHVVVKLKKVAVSFGVGENIIKVLKDIHFNLYSGEFVIIAGPSGSGKSTLLHTLLGLEKPTAGKVILRGSDLYQMTENQRAQYRRKKIGMVFQHSNWIKACNVWENVAYPLWLFGVSQLEAKERAFKQLENVGLLPWANRLPMELSGGQQQRVSVARALVTDPGIIIADEPTGNLDTVSSSEIITLLAKLNRELNKMVIMVTHDMAFLPIANRRIILTDGKVIHDEHD